MIRSRQFLFFVFLSCVLNALPLYAESSPAQKVSGITAQAEAEKSAITLGEPSTLRVSVSLEEGSELLNGIPDPEAHGLSLKELKVWQDREGKKLVFVRTWTLTGFQLGRFMVEPIEIAYRVKGGEVQTAKTNAVYITLESIAAGEKKVDIRDVKGVVKLSSKIMKYLVPVGVPLLLLGLLAAYLLYFRKKELSRIRNRIVHTPSQEALQRLHELADSTLMRDGKIKTYYFTFSEILKTYLEKQFGIQALEATTAEIVQMMKRVPAQDGAKKKITEVLEAADYAKFAKWEPQPAEFLALNKKAEEVISELLTPLPSEGEARHAVS